MCGVVVVFVYVQQTARLKAFETLGNSSKNFNTTTTVAKINGPWNVSFDPKWGGPKSIIFNELIDWTSSNEDGIKYYSGTATYTKSFDLGANIGQNKTTSYFIDLGGVK